MSSDDNPMYLDFWPVVSKMWRKKIGVIPVLLYFGKDHQKIDTTYGHVINFDTPTKTPIATCWARYWFAAQQCHKVCIISDIDMIPLSTQYFVRQIENYDAEKSYLHLNPCIETYGRLPSCYHVATGDNFHSHLEIGDVNFEDSLKKLLYFNFDNSNCFIKGEGDPHWCYDEFYATEVLKNKDIIMLPREGGQSGRRIDRTDWNYDAGLLRNGYYYDSHSLRPYQQFKNEIDQLLI